MEDAPDPLSLADAWEELHSALPPGWTVGRPSYHHEDRSWHLYAWDPAERPRVGRRQRERAVSAPTEVGVVQALSRSLRSPGAGGAG